MKEKCTIKKPTLACSRTGIQAAVPVSGKKSSSSAAFVLPCKFLFAGVLLLLCCMVNGLAQSPVTNLRPDPGLQPPRLITKPLPHYDYDRLDYGMNMGIEQTRSGRMWSCWTAGGDDPNSFIVVMFSDDKGQSWSKPVLAVDAQDPGQSYRKAVQNGNLWTDPLGRLWFFFDQSMYDFDGRAGLWYSLCENPDEGNPRWSSPQRIWNGTCKSKPIVLKSGEWLLPVSLLNRNIIDKEPPYFKDAYHELDSLRMANVFVSTDNGKTWKRQGGVRFPNPSYDEHHFVELANGHVWMTARTQDGIWQSRSTDKGMTWSDPEKYLPHTSSRHFIRRLSSGNLLLVKHGEINERTHTRSKLMAFLSEDEGNSWMGGLMIDERRGVSYPDGFQDPEGVIHVTYDRNRATDGHIMLATFTEEDILQRSFNSPRARSKYIIAQPLGLDVLPPPSTYLKK